MRPKGGTHFAKYLQNRISIRRNEMKKIFIISLTSIILSFPVLAQEKKTEAKKYSTSIAINSDSFFGLTPIATVGVPLTDNIDLTGYAIFWSGIGNSHAFGHWTEFGGGVNITALDGALKVNPQLGILNGTLLSRGNLGAGGGPMFMEGIVPNATLFFEKAGFELEFYGGYYLGTRAASGTSTTNSGVSRFAMVDPDVALLASSSEGAAALGSARLQANQFPNRNARNNYTHFWAFPGYKVTEWLSAGVHWEELRFRPSGGDGDYDSTVYSWRGLYTTIKAGSGSLRIAFGDSSSNEPSGITGTQLRNDVSTIRTANSSLSNEQAVNLALTNWLNANRPNNAMNGTYYRVTYTHQF